MSARKWGYISPDEIIAEIRKIYPTERVLKPPRPVAPRVTFANEYLYGVAVYVYGEGIKGQYLRHQYFEREGQRYWLMELGLVTIFGILPNLPTPIPLTNLGLLSPLAYRFNPEEFVDFRLEEIPLDSLECREADIVNLDRVMRGEDPILIIDKYDLLRQRTPDEYLERIMEQQNLIETQQKALWEYERVINDYKANFRIMQSRLAKYQELLRNYENKVIRLSTELTNLQTELIKLREEALYRGAEADALEQARSKLRDVIDRLTDWNAELASLVQQVRAEARQVREVSPKEEKEETETEESAE